MLRTFSSYLVRSKAEARILIASCLGGAILAFALSMLLPADYVARTSILIDPSQDSSAFPALGQLSELVASSPFGSIGARENGYTYIEVMRSRSVIENLLREKRSLPGDHRSYFETIAPTRGSERDRWEGAIRRLRKSVSMTYSTRDHVLYLSVRSKDPLVSAEIANLLISELHTFNATVRTSRAREAVEFIGQRVDESRAALADAEGKLASFQEANARIGNAPGLRLTEKRLNRNVQLSEDVYALLAKQLEMARIQEKRENPVFTVVDRAEEPARPERLSHMVAFGLGFLLAGSASV
ncbi:MAG: hypothetical protein ACREMY_24030, partial [bacterium]